MDHLKPIKWTPKGDRWLCDKRNWEKIIETLRKYMWKFKVMYSSRSQASGWNSETIHFLAQGDLNEDKLAAITMQTKVNVYLKW